MSFHKQSFQTRFTAMGDEAEQIFWDLHGDQYEPFGLVRPKFSMKGMRVEMRATPDFIGRKHFVEVQGMGADRLLKLKMPKFNALAVWEQWIGPVTFFVWDRTEQQTFWATLEEFADAADKHGIPDKYPEGTPILKLPIEHFPVPGCPLPATFTDGVSSKDHE